MRFRDRSKKTTTLAAGALGALVFATTGAGAQTTGFAIDRVEPAEAGSTWFSQESLDWSGHLQEAAGLVLDAAYRPLAVYGTDGSVISSIIRDQVLLHVGGSLTLFDRMQVALSLPVAIFQDGQIVNLDGSDYAPPGTAAVGDLRLGGVVRLYGKPHDRVTLAAGLWLLLPTGSRADYTSDGSVRAEPRFLASGEVRWFVYAAQLGFQYRGLQDKMADITLGSELTFGASAGATFLQHRLVVGPEVFGSSIVTGGSAFASRVTPLEAMLGVHFAQGDFRFGLGAGVGLTKGLGSPASRWSAVVEWVPAAHTEGGATMARRSDPLANASER